ncbi:MAG: tRNA (N6-isopentenyl adenosine(37)-C2)-methylthiotransferase MiaB [Victivallaceae bacterium]|nr:tRNA (N6-isopentenyl adenosine(37)-C2)-methylthiotransferase MiaB [Victivallaceae bacterium]
MKVFIKTYGCQMNERDTEAIAGMLARQGYSIVNDENAADILIFNTCSVREQAERKAIGKIGIMKKLKKQKPHLIIGIMGCMAQNLGEKLLQDLPHADFVIGTGRLHKLPETLALIRDERRQLSLLTGGKEILTSMDTHYRMANAKDYQAYIAVMRGCNRFCSYCIVPHVRGREFSREIGDVVAEAKGLAADGVREIMLLGQNVAAFGLGGDTNPPPEDCSPLADLLFELNKIDGLCRIRFVSPYPSYFTDKLISTMGALEKVCHNIHLPLQSGSDRILKKMNRQYTAGKYLEIVNKLRKAMPDITFSTDIIVGFPGETDEDFEATREMMKKVGYDNAFIFKYSPRRGTPAAAMSDQTVRDVKEERNQILLRELHDYTAVHNKNCIGSIQEVLVEGPSRRNDKRWSGKTGTFKVVVFEPDKNTQRGELVKVRIIRATSATLFGKLVVTEPPFK